THVWPYQVISTSGFWHAPLVSGLPGGASITADGGWRAGESRPQGAVRQRIWRRRRGRGCPERQDPQAGMGRLPGKEKTGGACPIGAPGRREGGWNLEGFGPKATLGVAGSDPRRIRLRNPNERKVRNDGPPESR